MTHKVHKCAVLLLITYPHLEAIGIPFRKTERCLCTHLTESIDAEFTASRWIIARRSIYHCIKHLLRKVTVGRPAVQFTWPHFFQDKIQKENEFNVKLKDLSY